jgi:beta-glucanase (GH16 family)
MRLIKLIKLLFLKLVIMKIKPKIKYKSEIILKTNKSISFPVVLAWLLLLLFFSCKKEIKVDQTTSVPVLTTNVTNITSTSADIDGNVTNNGGSVLTDQGFCWGINDLPNLPGNKTSFGTGSESFTIKMTGLTPGTNYYVRAYATSSVGTGYGNQKIFQTLIGGGEEILGFGPFTTILATANIQPPASWNQNLPLSDQVNSRQWVLNPSFSDEFNTTSLNATNWTNTFSGLGFNQGNDPSLLKPTTSGMEFYMRDGPISGQYQYRGSWIGSKSKLLYGYIESSIDMAANYANNNMFLFAKDNTRWTEIDVVETYPLPRSKGVRASSNAHVWYSPLISTHTEQQVAFVLSGGQTFADGYHVFGLAWTPTKLSWYIDGHLVREGVNTSWHQPLKLFIGIWDIHGYMSQMPVDQFNIEAMKAKYVRVWTATN